MGSTHILVYSEHPGNALVILVILACGNVYAPVAVEDRSLNVFFNCLQQIFSVEISDGLCIVQIAGKKTVTQLVVKGNLLAYPFPDPVRQGGIAFWKIQLQGN